MVFREKTLHVEAVQWDGKDETIEEIQRLGGYDAVAELIRDTRTLVVQTALGGNMVDVGDWIVAALGGGLVVVCKGIFEGKYEAVPPIQDNKSPAYWMAYTKLRVALTRIGIVHEAICYDYPGDRIEGLSEHIIAGNKAVQEARELARDERTYEKITEK